ncbi:MAG: efflux RND transporter permease subunit [Pseudomonadota bacterium]
MSPSSSNGNSLIAWFAGNSVAANLLMFFLLVGGFLALRQTNSEVLPPIDPRLVSVRVVFPGATPVDVEDGVTRRIEEAVSGLEGVARVSSSAVEGLGSVTLELDDFAIPASVRDDVRSSINRLVDFPPEDAEEPQITILKPTSAVARLVVVGDVSERALKSAGEEIERGLLAADGISIVTLQGTRKYEISIEVAPDKLERYGLGIDQVANAIRAESLNLSAGTVRTSGGDILLRTNTEAREASAFEDLVIVSDATGRRVRLGELATVRDGFEELPLSNTYNGKPAVFVQVDRSVDEDAFAVRDAVVGFLEEFAPPPGIDVFVTSDETETVADRINLLARNGLLGLVLVFVFLSLTLDLRLAFWTSVGIPVAFLGGVILFGQFTSINMTSLMGLILVLGIVVDDAIVVGEAIYDAQSTGGPGLGTAVTGATGVFAPVTVGVTTSFVAFATLMFLPGVLGQLLQPVPIVVLSVLLFSLVEVFFILPNHMAHGDNWSRGAMLTLRARVQAGIEWMREGVFVPMSQLATKMSWVVIVASISILLITHGILSGGYVRFVFFPVVEGDRVSVTLEMPAGTLFEQTSMTMDRIVEGGYSAIGGRDSDEYRSMAVTLGGSLASGFDTDGTNQQAELAVATLELAPPGQRSLTSAQIERAWREAIGDVPGVRSLTFESAGLSGTGADISLNLTHRDAEQLSKAAVSLTEALVAIRGVTDVESTAEPGKRQVEFDLNPTGYAAGLSVADLGRHLRNAFFGEEVQRFQRGREEVRVLVRYPQEGRQSIEDLARMQIPLPGGAEVPLVTVAEASETRDYANLQRINGRRTISISADVDEAVTTPNAVQAVIESTTLEQLRTRFSGLEIEVDGQTRNQAEDLGALANNFLFAVLGIYVLLASILRSYTQPLIILAIIPFGLTGAVVGHMVMGFDLTFLSLFGVVALSGVIINDSIVLIDYYNRLRRQGRDRDSSIIEAVRRRFRPILLTTITTFIGLLPMVTETSMQARFLIPMAISLAFGILFAALVIFLLVPALLSLESKAGIGMEVALSDARN